MILIKARWWINFWRWLLRTKKINQQALLGLPIVLYRNPLSKEAINHEKIHVRQARDLLLILLWVMYLLEFLINVIAGYSFYEAYRQISFEKEAYANQNNLNYLKDRKYLAHLNYF